MTSWISPKWKLASFRWKILDFDLLDTLEDTAELLALQAHKKNYDWPAP